MEEKFTVAIPDEPYKDSFEQNKTIEITYNGPEYLVITYDPKNNIVQNIDGCFDDIKEINLEDFADDRYEFTILNAKDNLLIASIISNFWYTTEEVEPYVETLPTGEIYTFKYSDRILDELFHRWDMTYNKEKNEYSINYVKHPVSQEQFLQTLGPYVAKMQKIKEEEKNLSDEAIAKINHIIDWCNNFEETYGSTDHYKIPFPTFDLEP